MSLNKFITPGSLLTVDLLIVSLVNWIYWLIISKVATPLQVGQATSVYSFAVLTSTIALLGLDYTLVKKSSLQRTHVLGTAIIIELLFTSISAPILLYLLSNILYHGSLYQLGWIAVAIVIFSSLRYVLRYALLGISDARSVLIINSIGAALQLAIGYFLVSIGYGALGILASFLVNVMLVTVLSFIIARRRSFELLLGSVRYTREILKDALINMPAPLAKTFIYSLSVVLLASFGINQSNVGTFYIALMVSFIAGGFGGNIAFMIIPISSTHKKDFSADSIRIGLTLTAPLIVALMVAPKSILSIIGSAYVSADIILLVLSAAIFPYIIVTNAISKFNNLGKSKQIIAVGSIQLVAFLLPFLILVPYDGTLGAAFSILIACISSALASILWSDRILVKYVIRCFLPVVTGLASGYLLKLLFVSVNPTITIPLAVAVTLATIFGLKNTSANEIVVIAKGIMRQN